MDDSFNSATPEQKLHTLTAELRTPVEIIRGVAGMIKTINKSNKIEPEGILSEINSISEAADKINNLLDEVVRSKWFYVSSKNLSSTDILLSLRQRLLDARERNDVDALRNLAAFFNILWEIVDEKKIRGRIGRILEDLERSAYDSIGGISWKSVIPSEEEIISDLNRN